MVIAFRNCICIIILFVGLFISSKIAYTQIGGNNTYEFLNLITCARTASLGGNTIALQDDDINLVFQNPALITSNMHNHLALSYINYFSDINYGHVAYARDIKKLGTFYSGLKYINYGKFTRADETALKTGEFSAGEYAFYTGYKYFLTPQLSIGAHAKFIYSHLDTYNSFGVAFDAGALYESKNKLFNAAFVLHNIGYQIKPYRKNNREPLPFEAQLAISKKMEHAPFRILIAAHHLETLDLSYINTENPEIYLDPDTGEEIIKRISLGEKIMRHFIAGIEFNPFNNFYLRFGYNYQRRQEMKITTRPAMVGFSWGFGLRISKFYLSYGRATYHLAGASNHFSVSVKLADFYIKDNTSN